jgi:CheY-like chemotaxis protein
MFATASRPVQILLVEDSPGDVRLTQEVLKDATIANDLHVATDGQQALEYLRGADRRPDLILLDLNMPRMNGRDVLRELRADPALCRIPVIMLTTSSADDDVESSYALGANCFITKPIDFGRFTDVVRAIEQFWLSVVCLPSTA